MTSVGIQDNEDIAARNEPATEAIRFETDYRYTDRRTKATYVWLKYQSLLRGRILDVGADECYLRSDLPDGAYYWGIGLGSGVDAQVDLEKQLLPVDDDSFDCVLCLDVLEHLDNIHDVFDDLCRVTRSYVIVSLPNPYATFFNMLRSGDYRPGCPMKFYGLPKEQPDDRHKWFFSAAEAERFIRHRAKKNRMRLVQLDYEQGGGEGVIRRLIAAGFVRPDVDVASLCRGSLWAVLTKE